MRRGVVQGHVVVAELRPGAAVVVEHAHGRTRGRAQIHLQVIATGMLSGEAQAHIADGEALSDDEGADDRRPATCSGVDGDRGGRRVFVDHGRGGDDRLQVGRRAHAVEARGHARHAAVVGHVAGDGEATPAHHTIRRRLCRGKVQRQGRRLGVESERQFCGPGGRLAEAVGGVQAQVEDVAVSAGHIPDASPSAVGRAGVGAVDRRRAAAWRLHLQAHQRDARVIVGVTAQVVGACRQQVAGLPDAEELRRGAVHRVVRPQPFDRLPRGRVRGVVDLHRQAGPRFGAEAGVHRGVQRDRGLLPRPYVAQNDRLALSAEQLQRVEGGHVGGHSLSRAGPAVAVGKRVADRLPVADRGQAGVQEAKVGRHVGRRAAEQQIAEPEQVVGQQAVNRAGRRGRQADLRVHVALGGGARPSGPVRADAGAKVVPMEGVVEGQVAAGDGAAVHRVGVGQDGPQPHRSFFTGEGQQVEAGHCRVADAEPGKRQVEVGLAAGGEAWTEASEDAVAVLLRPQVGLPVPFTASPAQQQGRGRIAHPHQVIGRQTGRQGDDGAVRHEPAVLHGEVRVEGGRCAASLGVQVDEQVAVRIPVRAGPGQAERLHVPCDVELLLVEAQRASSGAAVNAHEGADSALTPDPPPHPPNIGGSEGGGRGEVDVVGGQGAVHVDWAEGLPAGVAQGVVAAELDHDLLTLTGGVAGGQRPAGWNGLPRLVGQGARDLGAPAHGVAAHAAAVGRSRPGQRQVGRGGRLPGRHRCSARGQRRVSPSRGQHVHDDRLHDLRGVAGQVQRPCRDVVRRAVGQRAVGQAEGEAPHAAQTCQVCQT